MSDPVRICVIGNSHMAALRAGWPAASLRHPGLSLTFRGRGQNGMLYVHAEDTRLVCTDENGGIWMQRATGVSEIETAGYDGFVLVGMWPGLRWLETLLDRTTIPGLPGPAVMMVSSEAATAAMSGAYLESVEYYVARLLRGIHGSEMPIFALPCPLMSALGLEATGPTPWARPDLCRAAIEDGSAADWRRIYEEMAATALSHAPGLIRLEQPEQTIDRHIMTHAGYRRDAPQLGLDGPQPDHDFNHMNAAFGEAVIDAIAPRLLARG